MVPSRLGADHGTSFSSDAMVYGGGDSGGILRRELLEELLRKEGCPM